MLENVTISRIRGCLFGALAGDCLGYPYEVFVFGPYAKEDDVSDFVKTFPKGNTKEKLQYTDDTSMMRSVAQSLIHFGDFNAEDVARRFTETYEHEIHPRGYGAAVGIVFQGLKVNNYKDPFGPAKQQFNGSGSYGNGGAMRVAVASLFHANDFDKAIETAKNQCLITHTHPDGIMGTVLQAAAVYIALHAEPGTLDEKTFMMQIRGVLKKHEVTIYPRLKLPSDNPYNKKIDSFDKLLAKNKSISDVAGVLGNGEAALDSVPSAIFSFVRCLKPTLEIDIENPLARTIAYAISLKGDTDTIATMAGAIAGAYYGDSYIPESWIDSFEGAADYVTYADAIKTKLFGQSACS